MSHFTRMRTTLTDGDVLERSLRDLGHQVERGQVSVRGYRGQRTPVELRVPTKSSGYDVGFRRNGGTAYEMVADWWGIKETTPELFLATVARQYAVVGARTVLERQGFALVEETRERSGEVRLLLRRLT
jgi:hypothetical protein